MRVCNLSACVSIMHTERPSPGCGKAPIGSHQVMLFELQRLSRQGSAQHDLADLLRFLDADTLCA